MPYLILYIQNLKESNTKNNLTLPRIWNKSVLIDTNNLAKERLKIRILDGWCNIRVNKIAIMTNPFPSNLNIMLNKVWKKKKILKLHLKNLPIYWRCLRMQKEQDQSKKKHFLFYLLIFLLNSFFFLNENKIKTTNYFILFRI